MATHRSWILALYAGFVFAPATQAHAQSADAGARALDEIVVTARKREESLQDVPVSVAAVTTQDLEDFRIREVRDLTNKLPNFIMPTTGFNSLQDVSVRGVNVGVRNAGFNPSVSFYVDGVYQGRPSNFNQMLVDVDRVEVLLGPQGTLFGNNTIGGVVNIVTPDATSEREGFTRFGVGNYDLRELELMGNGALTDSIDGRITLARHWRDGYQDNLYTGEDHGNLDRWSARGKLRWSGERASIQFTGAYQTADERPASQEYIEAGASNFPADPPFDNGYDAAPEPFVYFQDPSRSEVERFDAIVDFDYELNDRWDLVSITAYKDTSAEDLIDNDFAAEPRLRADIWNLEEQKIFSQELRLQSDPAERATWTFGLYYLDDQVDLLRDYDYLPPFTILGALGANGLAVVTESRLDTRSAAIFGNLEYDLLPGLEASFGLRYSSEDMDATWNQAEVFRVLGVPTNEALPLGPGGGLLIANAPTYDDSRSDDLVSGTFTLSWFLADDRMLYGRYARGTKSGGFNLEPLPNPVPDDRSFEQETLDNYEIGFKTQWLDNRLRFNLTAFYQEYHDLQRADVMEIEIAPGITGLTRVIRNAAEVEVKGGELLLEAEPIDDLLLRAAWGRANAKFVEYTILSGDDLTGQPLSGVPEWNGALEATYTRALANGMGLRAGVAAEFRGDRQLGQADAVAVGVEGYTVLNAQVALVAADGRWELNLWGNNLADELYITQRGAGNDFYSADVVAFGMPRTYGANLTVHFGGN